MIILLEIVNNIRVFVCVCVSEPFKFKCIYTVHHSIQSQGLQRRACAASSRHDYAPQEVSLAQSTQHWHRSEPTRELPIACKYTMAAVREQHVQHAYAGHGGNADNSNRIRSYCAPLGAPCGTRQRERLLLLSQ